MSLGVLIGKRLEHLHYTFFPDPAKFAQTLGIDIEDLPSVFCGEFFATDSDESHPKEGLLFVRLAKSGVCINWVVAGTQQPLVDWRSN